MKPPHNNNGSGVYVIKSPDEIPDAPVCVQQYIRNPLLIDGKKVPFSFCLNFHSFL